LLDGLLLPGFRFGHFFVRSDCQRLSSCRFVDELHALALIRKPLNSCVSTVLGDLMTSTHVLAKQPNCSALCISLGGHPLFLGRHTGVNVLNLCIFSELIFKLYLLRLVKTYLNVLLVARRKVDHMLLIQLFAYQTGISV